LPEAKKIQAESPVRAPQAYGCAQIRIVPDIFPLHEFHPDGREFVRDGQCPSVVIFEFGFSASAIIKF
jgi:hypothetical protein